MAVGTRRDEGSATWNEPSPRPGRRALGGRFSSGHVVMVAAGLVGLVVSIAVLRDEPTGVRVAVAAHEIHEGEVIMRSDLRTERVDASERVLDTLIRSRDLDRTRGRIATATIRAGDLVARGTLKRRAASDGLRAMSVPIDASRAVAGRLEAGDRVDVLFAGDREASIIVVGAKVLAVDQRARGGIGETSSPFTITLAVDARQSQLLAAAVDDGGLSIARTTGAASSKDTAPVALERTS
ncbi:MAG: Flp pilus assembly protein CpaB [Acidimicrobiia bacterium]